MAEGLPASPQPSMGTPRSTPRGAPREMKRRKKGKAATPLVDVMKKLAAADPSDEYGSLRRLSARLGQPAHL